jgi:hypothetical protein
MSDFWGRIPAKENSRFLLIQPLTGCFSIGIQKHGQPIPIIIACPTKEQVVVCKKQMVNPRSPLKGRHPFNGSFTIYLCQQRAQRFSTKKKINMAK